MTSVQVIVLPWHQYLLCSDISTSFDSDISTYFGSDISTYFGSDISTYFGRADTDDQEPGDTHDDHMGEDDQRQPQDQPHVRPTATLGHNTTANNTSTQ